MSNNYPDFKTQTNYDRIISKTPEELALFLMDASAKFCDSKCWLDWLKQEATE